MFTERQWRFYKYERCSLISSALGLMSKQPICKLSETRSSSQQVMSTCLLAVAPPPVGYLLHYCLRIAKYAWHNGGAFNLTLHNCECQRWCKTIWTQYILINELMCAPLFLFYSVCGSLSRRHTHSHPPTHPPWSSLQGVLHRLFWHIHYLITCINPI